MEAFEPEGNLFAKDVKLESLLMAELEESPSRQEFVLEAKSIALWGSQHQISPRGCGPDVNCSGKSMKPSDIKEEATLTYSRWKWFETLNLKYHSFVECRLQPNKCQKIFKHVKLQPTTVTTYWIPLGSDISHTFLKEKHSSYNCLQTRWGVSLKNLFQEIK